MKTKTTDNTLTFRVLGRKPLRGTVKNPEARLGDVAAKVTKRLGLAGAFECLDPQGQVISPETRLADLDPREEVTLASELTPA